MRYLFAFSLTLNLLLLTKIGLARIDPAGPDDRQAAGLIAAAGSAADGDDLHAYLQRLAAASASSRQLRLAALAWLEAGITEPGPAARPGYWQAGYSAARDEMARRLADEAALREGLLAQFGPNAATDPLFDRAFRPLGPSYDFLSDEAQIALQRQWLDALDAGLPGTPAASCLPEPPEQGAVPPPTPASIMSDDEFFEYRLRFSATADRLRDSFPADDARAFRAAFTMLEQLEQAPSLRARLDSQQQLRALIGDAAFEQLESTRDPLFPRLERLLLGDGHTVATARRAYSVISQTREDVLAIVASGSPPESGLRELTELKAAESDILIELLGHQTAGELLGILNGQALDPAGTAARCLLMHPTQAFKEETP